MNPSPALSAQQLFAQALHALPLVAILRGLTPPEAPTVGQALADNGFQLIEVPLNSPRPLESIEALARLHPGRLVGAGTVMTVRQVHEVHAVGGRLIVSPHFDPEVVLSAIALDMVCLPGAVTPTEVFGALAAGAQAVKLFPAELVPLAAIKALRAVVPMSVPLFPVGGVTPTTMADYRAVGASGFGIGSALYTPGRPVAELSLAAQAFVQAWRVLP